MTSAHQPPAGVDLGREPDFRLGGLLVSPSAASVRAGAATQRVEPRVMQVLVVLARHAGRTVTRDQLIDACWGGRIVGDDAVSRVIAQVRRLGRIQDPPPFVLDTVPKVGFRLIPAEAADTCAKRDGPGGEIVLAVLPFDNLTQDPQAGHIADGVSEEILQTLAKREGLKVIGRTSSFQFRGTEKVAHEVARQLGATHILDGAVRLSGSRVRISAHIESCATQTTLWSDQREQDRSELFALQAEIAMAAAAALSHALSVGAPSRPIDPEAYDLYLRARISTDRWSGGSDADLLERAVARAADFAGAWASLALTRAIQGQEKKPPEITAPLLEQARIAADRALSLDPDIGIAHLANALRQPSCGAFEERDAHLALALKGSPQDPWILFHAAQAAQSRGRLNEALAYSTRAREIEPYWPQGIVQLASILEDTGHGDQADALFDSARARWPNIDYVVLGALYRAAYARRWDRAEDLMESIRRLGPHGETTSRALRWVGQLRQGGPAGAVDFVERARKRLAQTGDVSLNIGLLCRDGQADAAFDLMERASFAHLFEPTGRFLFGDLSPPALFFAYGKTMRSDPRFVRLCAKLGLARYWLNTGNWPDCVEETAPFYDFKAECQRAVN